MQVYKLDIRQEGWAVVIVQIRTVLAWTLAAVVRAACDFPLELDSHGVEYC